MDSTYYCQIGPLRIKINNKNEISNSIIMDLGATESEKELESDIEMLIGGNEIHLDYIPIIFSAKGSMNFNTTDFFVGYLNEVDYAVKNLFNDGRTVLYIDKDKKNIKKRIKGIYKGKRNLIKDVILSYSLFWYVAHLSLVEKKSAFIHAGVFQSEKGATIITGTGGCGKTSTLFKILEDSRYKYLSEDFGIIDDKGKTYFNPKPVSVYASDMEFGQLILKKHFSRFSTREKLLWNFKRKILRVNPMKKINPLELMKERIGNKAKINNVLYFVRNSDKMITMSDISTEDLAERVLDASMRELKTLSELLLLMGANAPMEYQIPTSAQIREKTKNIYINSFENISKKIIHIPLKTKPKDLISFLDNNELI